MFNIKIKQYNILVTGPAQEWPGAYHFGTKGGREAVVIVLILVIFAHHAHGRV